MYGVWPPVTFELTVKLLPAHKGELTDGTTLNGATVTVTLAGTEHPPFVAVIVKTLVVYKLFVAVFWLVGLTTLSEGVHEKLIPAEE